MCIKADMNDQPIRELYQRYLNGRTTEQETIQILQMLAHPAKQELAESLLHDSFELEAAAHELSEEQQQRILSDMLKTRST
ncbi:MAG: hypothetical protein JST19_10025 [Bacteroidetes bacterium]|nr:hypothetical protein [Bacteroidota bacterium]